MKVEVMTPAQMAQFEKLQAEFIERQRRADLFPELVAALEKLVDRDHTFFEGKVITGITYDDIQFARAVLEKAKS